MKKLSERAIRAMTYESRLKNYEREKQELFMKSAHLPEEEVQTKHQELIRKWQI